MSISDLKLKFESLGVKAQKALLLARYIVEPKTGGDVVLNENAKSTYKNVISTLLAFIGNYFIYTDSDRLVAGFVSNEEMKQRVCHKFGHYRPALNDALSSEDYDDTGIIDLMQVREAVDQVFEDVEEDMMDWMLYFVYQKSAHDVDRMHYKELISMLDEAALVQAAASKKQERLSSAKPKRPESSTPDKIKQHNAPKPLAEPAQPVSDRP